MAPVKQMKTEAMQYLTRSHLCNLHSSSPPYSSQGPWPSLSIKSSQPSPSLPSFTGHAYGVPANHSSYRDCWAWQDYGSWPKKKKTTKNLRTFRNPKLVHCVSAVTNYIGFWHLLFPDFFYTEDRFGRWQIQLLFLSKTFSWRICD